jgi:enoyl-CoA hydratase
MKPGFSTHVADFIGEVVIDNPPVNALDSAGWNGLAAAIDALMADDAVRVLIIRAEGRGFCAGVNIKELAEHPDRIIAVNKGNYETFRAIHRGFKPVIAAVHGFVLGGGIGICGAADIIVAAPDARFGVPEVDRGALGAGAHLARMFPEQKVRYMYFTGESIDAAEAHRLGAVERVVPREQLRETALEIARMIARKSPAVMKLAKEALNGTEPGDLEHDYRWEQGFTAQAYLTAESAETRRAFVEKREVKFDK